MLSRFWKYRSRTKSSTLHYSKKFKFLNYPLDFKEIIVRNEFLRVNQKWPTEEFVIQVKQRLRIEPLFGIGIHHLHFIDPRTVQHWSTLPSIKGFVKSFFKSVNSIHEAIIFDYNLGLNYFHFFNDILPKLFLIDFLELNHLPLIIHKRIFESNHFQFFYLKFPLIKNRPWIIIESNQYVDIKLSWHLKPMGYHQPYQKKIKNLVSSYFSVEKSSQRIFLNRSLTAGRNIQNMDELRPILLKYGFDLIENENLSVAEQISLFSNVKYLISIHGAGNTNILFSQKDLKFLEIMPNNKIASHYYWLSCSLGISNYEVLLGNSIEKTDLGKDGAFHMDPDTFEEMIKKFISN